MPELDLPALRESHAVAERGNNLVFVAPPSPAWGEALLAGLLGQEGRDGRVLALAPEASLDEWARAAEHMATPLGVRVGAAHTPARLGKLLGTDGIQLVITTLAAAYEQLRRSSLDLGALRALLLVWPEAWPSDELLTALLQDLPKETQRILITTDAQATTSLAERYCWRAPLVDLVSRDAAGPPPAVRVTPVAWHARTEAVANLAEQLDPASLAVWTVTGRQEDRIRDALAARGAKATIGTAFDATFTQIIAFDPPTPALLADLAGRGELILLVPPGAERYVARIAPSRRPVHTAGTVEQARSEAEAARRVISEAVGAGPSTGALLSLAPLFERHEATAVAAALFDLWEKARTSAPAALPAPRAPLAQGSKIWLGIGTRDSVTTADLMGLMVKEMGMARESVGRIEIRESFALVEVHGVADPEDLADRIAGKTIRKRRLVARLDRGGKGRKG